MGGVAVSATLLYLAIQVRQGNHVGRAESDRSVARDYNNILLGLRDPTLRNTVRHAMTDFEGLSKDEQLQADAWLAAMFLQGQTLFLLDRRRLAGELSGSYVRAFASFLQSPGLTQWWSWAKAL